VTRLSLCLMVNVMNCVNFKLALLKFCKTWRVLLPSIFVGL
jgi:hypothetical protein